MGRSRYAGEMGRRLWYQLEDRHTGLAAGRIAAAAAVALGAVVVPADALARADGPILLACAAAAVLHALLWLAPRRWPRRLRLAVDASLLVDAAWAGVVAWAAGGPASPMTALFLVTALWAALGYSARTGLKAGFLASLAFLWLVWLSDDGRLWSLASVARLVLFWGVLAGAVAGAAAGERELRIRAERLAVLHDAARRLIAAPDPEAMIAAAQGAAERLLPDWRVLVRRGPGPEEVRLARAAGEGVVAVPVSGAGGVIGVIECRRPLRVGQVRHRVRQREILALETLAAGLGGSLWRAELMARVERQSLTDGLTGLVNRRGLDRDLARELARSRRSRQPVALCLMDIDRFKSFNDDFGHLAGDEALVAVAGIVSSSCREGDVAARYGGEEIAVVLPGTTLADGLQVAERIRAAVAAHPMPHRRVSVSIGVAVTSGECSAEVLIEAADRALYDAKESGRDRVVPGWTDTARGPLAP